MDIHAVVEGLGKLRVFGEVCQHHQLYLGVVGAEEHHAGPGYESLADAAPFLVSYRNVLQVGVDAGKAAGGGTGLPEGGVDAGAGIGLFRQSVHVSGLELCQSPVPQYHLGHHILQRQLLQYRCVGGVTGLGLLYRLELAVGEKHLLELLGRVYVELLAALPVDLFLDCRKLGFQLHRVFLKHMLVYAYSLQFHVGQDGDQRHLHIKEELLAMCLHYRVKVLVEPECDISILGGILGGLFQRHILEGLALGHHLVVGYCLVTEVVVCQVVHVVDGDPGIHQPGRDHGVKPEPLRFNTPPSEYLAVELEVLPHQFQTRVFQDLPQLVFDYLFGYVIFPLGLDRDVEALFRPYGNREAHRLVRHKVKAVGLGIEGIEPRLFYLFNKFIQLVELSYSNISTPLCLWPGGFGLRCSLGARLLCEQAAHGNPRLLLQPLDCALDSLGFKKGNCSMVIQIGGGEVVQALLQRHIGAELCQLPAHQALFLAGLQLGLVCPFYVLYIFVDAVYISIGLEQCHCPLGAYSLHSRDVVGTVAAQGQVIQYLLRPHAPFLVDPIPVHLVVVILAVAYHLDVVGNQLQKVLVPGDDAALEVFALALFCVCCNDVVGLVAVHP